ncbi:fungal-specific transcription factor domain-containing protein [Aspergillus avenaceus]|uniref:Fungal-specific transcription factor domain-containing protein n=1 Tax=Aspergillus avenaceus TaxID=36643 RepID=A0A5N6TRF6_ASPAV|nr:fungal-specific transcription factor domain-containing protein [Aspergillus avenaceus]
MQAEMQPSDERPARKMRKVTRACDTCKTKKKACTGTLPCGPCVRRQDSCTYNATYNRGVAVSPPPSSPRAYYTSYQGALSDTVQVDQVSVESSVHYTPQEHAQSVDCDGVPSTANSTSPEIRSHGSIAESTEVADRYWGPTSAHSFLGRAALGIPASHVNAVDNPNDASVGSTKSIFHFGDRAVPEPPLSKFQWPSLETAESLVHTYFEFASPTYRILHQQTVERIVQRLYQSGRPENGDSNSWEEGEVTGTSRAIILLVFSTATLFKMDGKGRMTDADEIGRETSEQYFSKADRILSQEPGAPSLESVQARLLMVLYLLCSSRTHRAWFTLGTTIQLIMILGLHSRRRNKDVGRLSLIRRECQRRVVWCSYTVDKYLSFMLGSPRLWHDEDLDEELPARANDEDVTEGSINPPVRDCVLDAEVFHALLARILSRAAKKPYVVAGIVDREEIKTIHTLCGSVEEWQAGLPPFLSGLIHPSSLVPLFRRQLTVLQLARYHALMFITRPLLLRNYAQIWTDCETSYVKYLCVCLTSAKQTVEMITSFARENQLFSAFWYSQYIAFNALSIIYIYLIQVQRNRISPLRQRRGSTENSMKSATELDESTLYAIAETAQYDLAQATTRNAPSWKYSTILEGLRRELERLRIPSAQTPNVSLHESLAGAGLGNPTISTISSQPSVPNHTSNLSAPFIIDPQTISLFDNFTLENDLILDLWPQLDSMPITFPG